MTQPLATRVYSAGARWVWVVQEHGSTLVSGTACSKKDAQARAQHARREIASVTPGGLALLGSNHKARRLAAKVQ